MDKIFIENHLEMTPSELATFAELVLSSLDTEDEETKQAWENEINSHKKEQEEKARPNWTL